MIPIRQPLGHSTIKPAAGQLAKLAIMANKIFSNQPAGAKIKTPPAGQSQAKGLASKRKMVNHGKAQTTNKLANGAIMEIWPNCQKINGQVHIWAARVTAKFSLISGSRNNGIRRNHFCHNSVQ